MIEPKLVTVFGGGGFIGRYVCERCSKTGVRVRVVDPRSRAAPSSSSHSARSASSASSGRCHRPRERRAARSRARLRSSTWSASFKGTSHAVHVEGARQHRRSRARGRRRNGVRPYVARSAPMPTAQSDYGRTKGQGEQAVRAAFPNATIIRPSMVFGAGGRIHQPLRRAWRGLPLLPVIAPKTRFQPVYRPRPGAGDRRGRARPQRRMAARPMRSAARK